MKKEKAKTKEKAVKVKNKANKVSFKDKLKGVAGEGAVIAAKGKKKVRLMSIRIKFVIIAALCVSIVTVGIGLATYSSMKNEVLSMAADQAEVIALMVSKQVDKSFIKMIKPGTEKQMSFRNVHNT